MILYNILTVNLFLTILERSSFTQSPRPSERLETIVGLKLCVHKGFRADGIAYKTERVVWWRLLDVCGYLLIKGRLKILFRRPLRYWVESLYSCSNIAARISSIFTSITNLGFLSNTMARMSFFIRFFIFSL